MQGPYRDTEFHKDDENREISGREMLSTMADDSASPSKSHLDDLDNAPTEKEHAFEAINQNSSSTTLDATAIVKDASYGLLNEVFSVANESVDGSTPRNFRDFFSAREPIHDLVGVVVSSKVTSHKSAIINEGIGKKKDLSVDSDLVSRGIGLVNVVPDDSSLSSVDCEHVGVLRNVTKSLKTAEETPNLAGKKMKFIKFIDSHASETEKAISEIPHVDSRDPHLDTSRLGCLAANTRENIPKTIGASRELRRASLLIPPHGANRCSSSLMSHGATRGRSTLFSNGANRYLSVSSAGGYSKPQTCKEKQENGCLLACSSESRLKQVSCSNHPQETCMPMVEKSSKAGEGSHLQTRVRENKWYHEDGKSGIKNTMAEEETIVGDVHIEVEVKKHSPVNKFDQQDAEMMASELLSASCMKNPKREPEEPQVFQNKMEVQHVKEEDIQRNFKIQAQRGTHFSNLMVDSEAKGGRLQSRFKDDYKKFPFSKKLRYTNNLGRISSMREGILACRRSSCVVSASLDHIYSSQKGGGESRDTTKDEHTQGNSKSQLKTKFCVFGNKRFLEKALVESGKRLQVQKMLRSGVYDRLAMPKDKTEVHSNRADKSSKEVNQTFGNIAVCENEVLGERLIEQKKRRHEQFKKSLMGKSREKAKEIAKRVALFERTQLLQSKRGNTSITSANTNIQETSDSTL